MKYAKRVLGGLTILISVLFILSLGGCKHWGLRDRDQHSNYDGREAIGENSHGDDSHNEGNRQEHHRE